MIILGVFPKFYLLKVNFFTTWKSGKVACGPGDNQDWGENKRELDMKDYMCTDLYMLISILFSCYFRFSHCMLLPTGPDSHHPQHHDPGHSLR